MTPTETAAKLQHFNDWRRGHHDDTAQPDPREIGEAIDAAIEMIDRLEAAEKERDELRAELKEVRYGVAVAHDVINTLLSRIEAMERQEPVAWMLNCQTLGGDTGWMLSWTQSGAGMCNRLSGEENERKLYALPRAKGE